MAIRLGQSMLYTSHDSVLPCIYMGQSPGKNPIILVEDKNDFKEITLIDEFKSLGLVREADKTSPTGWKVRVGSFAKNILGGDFKMKRPDKELLLKEFSIIRGAMKLRNKTQK